MDADVLDCCVFKANVKAGRQLKRVDYLGNVVSESNPLQASQGY